MKRVLPILSQGMLIVGGLLILAGLGWGVWDRVNAPPPPEITDAGAVVLAETAQPRPTAIPPTPTPTPTPTPAPTRMVVNDLPTPELLPEWTVTSLPPTPTPTSPPRRPTPIPTPTPTPLPAAEEPPTRIVAPTINLDAKIVPMAWSMVDRDGAMVSEWVVPENAAGWHENSAMPGNKENVVLSGHHNIEGKVFRYVIDLHLGDEITVYVNDTPYTYIVTDKYILKESGMPLRVRKMNAQWIMPSGDERLTLVTCWPYEWPGNSHRVIIVARPPDYSDPSQLIVK